MRAWSLPNWQPYHEFNVVDYNNVQHFLLHRTMKRAHGLTADERLITGQDNAYMAKTGELELFDYSWATLSYDG